MVICPHCKFKFAQINKDHIERCSKIPPAEELARMFDEDQKLTLNKLKKKYNIPSKYIAYRLRETKWTKEALEERGMNVVRVSTSSLNSIQQSITYQSKKKIQKMRKQKKLGKLKECKCGILIELEYKMCQYCKLEEGGIKTYRDMYDA